MDDDDFGADADFLAALAATDVGNNSSSNKAPAQQQARTQPPAQQRPPPTAPRIQQPTPQRIQKPGAAPRGQPTPRIVQPTPQALGGPGVAGASASGSSSTPHLTRGGPASGSTILVSPRQKGNPILAQLRSVPWEYSDITADYGLGPSTVALFLSLKYHRLHPEYVFARFRGLTAGGAPRHRLRILLALVDIENHEETLRELAKTSLVNQVTLILCWSAAEAARYLELYKTFEHASNFSAIRGQQAAGYAERLVQFATVPRAVNKSDAVALVGSFGSLRRAVQAEPEQLGLVAGWGEKKVQAWRRAVEAPFRVQKGRKKGAKAAAGTGAGTFGNTTAEAEAEAEAEAGEIGTDFDSVFNNRLHQAQTADGVTAAAAAAVAAPPPLPPPQSPKKRGTSAASTFSPPRPQRPPEELSDGIAAALAKLRDK
ncbi:DNA excision repair protein ERCC-1 [Sporothrix brasiliensis 5110]|uniref:DNA excision repair protein ERCC-1 n=1 Tax=Sporothrix brasiliensis 5110 TaxID=1398154 RepID=A0A0C2IDA6_9PEZI|nr:DNA excision repair protein ERCC-1 [Sporothrix brasiliensis 5110]KIH87251.1 DNA excision repair protein ERCC-1 [Sporothrix brasiliensis 5110]